VWRTDHSYVSAAFGLARVLIAEGDRPRAVDVLHSVPETSNHYVAAQVAAVKAHTSGERPAIAEITAAGHRLAALELDVARRAHLTVRVLRAAFDWLADHDQAVSGQVLGHEVTDRGLRLGLERCYRTLARLADTPEERFALVDRANAVRPRTMV
jgi:serine/threonine-protein kinase PknG